MNSVTLAVAEARKQREDDAIRVIERHISEYAVGGPDLRERDVELAHDVGLSVMVVEEAWDDAKQQRLNEEAAKKATASFGVGTTQLG